MEKCVHEEQKNPRCFVLTSELSDKQFTNYFRLNRDQFDEVFGIVKDNIYSEGCNARNQLILKKNSLYS